MMNLSRSGAAFEEARNYMPGGVNSPVRSYPHMDCPPPFIASAKGAHITDIDGNTYIDYVGSWGPMIWDMPTLEWFPRFKKRRKTVRATARRQ